jgi:hypothetical protein
VSSLSVYKMVCSVKKVNILKIKVFYKEDKKNLFLVGFGIDSPINLVQYLR